MNDKRCSRCEITKPLDEFYNLGGKRTGKMSECKLCSNARSREYSAKHREELRAGAAERQALYREQHKDDPEFRERKRAHDKLDSQRRSKQKVAKTKQWQKDHPKEYADHIRRKNFKRRAMHKRAVERFTYEEIFIRDGGICQICGNAVFAWDGSLDHKVPVARGGDHTRENVRLAHRRCNSRRGSKKDASA